MSSLRILVSCSNFCSLFNLIALFSTMHDCQSLQLKEAMYSYSLNSTWKSRERFAYIVVDMWRTREGKREADFLEIVNFYAWKLKKTINFSLVFV